MLGKIFGAVAGNQIAQHVRGINGPGGALLGAGAVAVARRLGPVGLVAAVAGSYVLKKKLHERKARAEAASTPPTSPGRAN